MAQSRATLDLLAPSLAAAALVEHRGWCYQLARGYDGLARMAGLEDDDLVGELALEVLRRGLPEGVSPLTGLRWAARARYHRMLVDLDRHRRRAWLNCSSLDGLAEVASDMPGALEELEAHERRHLVAAAVEELPDAERDVVQRWSRGSTLATIGARRGVTCQRAQRLLAAGLRRLRGQLAVTD